MANDSHSRPPGFLRATGKEWVRLLSIRPMRPAGAAVAGRALVVGHRRPRVGSAARALLAAIVLGVLLLLGAAGSTAGVVAIVLLVAGSVWELRHAYLAHKSVARIEEALEGIERGAGGPEGAPQPPR